jgi:hypothetical protein
MEDSTSAPNDSARTPPAAPPPPPRQSFARRHWARLTLLALVAVPVLVFGIWSASTLGWSYSNGERSGYMQKMSRKGWLCKTWEGTLYTNIGNAFHADSFLFTVRNDSLARLLESVSGRKVSLHYEQHVGVPTSCFGETEYFISAVRVLPD